MGAGTDPDAWKDRCMISIVVSATAYTFEGFTEDITAMDWGDKDIEGVALVNGGRVVKFNPMGDESITMKVYPINAENTSDEGVVQHFHPQNPKDATQPIAVDNSLERYKHKVILLWAETLPPNATTQPAIGNTAYRIQIINAYMTSYKPSYDDKTFSAEVTFKWTPFQKDGTANKREESTDGTVVLPTGTGDTSSTVFTT